LQVEIVKKLQRRQSNWKLDPPLRKACKADVAELCAAENAANSENGAVYACLLRNQDDLDPGCRKELGRAYHMALFIWSPGAILTSTCDDDVARSGPSTPGTSPAPCSPLRILNTPPCCLHTTPQRVPQEAPQHGPHARRRGHLPGHSAREDRRRRSQRRRRAQVAPGQVGRIVGGGARAATLAQLEQPLLPCWLAPRRAAALLAREALLEQACLPQALP
jgi:hypothetical protein